MRSWGGVLWSDVFLGAGRDFDVALVYLCLQPAVVAYCYYSRSLPPRVNTDRPLQTVLAGMASLCDADARCAGRWTLPSAPASSPALNVVVCSMARSCPPSRSAEVCLASTLFTVLTPWSYEIDPTSATRPPFPLLLARAIAAALLLRVAAAYSAAADVSTKLLCWGWVPQAVAAPEYCSSGGAHVLVSSSSLPAPRLRAFRCATGSPPAATPLMPSRRRPWHRRLGEEAGPPGSSVGSRRIRRRRHHWWSPEPFGRHPTAGRPPSHPLTRLPPNRPSRPCLGLHS